MTCERNRNRLDDYVDGDARRRPSSRRSSCTWPAARTARPEERVLRALLAAGGARCRSGSRPRATCGRASRSASARRAGCGARVAGWMGAGLAAAAAVVVAADRSRCGRPSTAPAARRAAAATPARRGRRCRRSWRRPSASTSAPPRSSWPRSTPRRDALPPETRAALDANLRTIDEALAEMRAALAQDPGNPRLAICWRRRIRGRSRRCGGW